MRRRTGPGALVLAAAALLAACDTGGNLLERPDLAAWQDVAGDPGRDVRRDTGRETEPWDPGEFDGAAEDPGDRDPGEDPGFDPGPSDDGRDPGPTDPGPTDPGTPDPGPKDPGPSDPGTDTGPAAPGVRLVTDKSALSTAVNLINGARSSIQMVQLEFLTGWAPDQIGVALANAVKRGVTVKVLMESEVEKNAPRLEALLASGVDAKLDTASKTLHAKLLVADRAKALVGSTNLSISSLNYNHEANLLLEGTALAEPLADYADALWSSQSSAARLPTATVSGVRLVGDGQYPDAVLPRIAAARTRAWLMLYHFGDDWSGDVGDLADALLDAKARGVDVRVILEQNDGSWVPEVTDSNRTSGGRLSADGIAVRYDPVDTTTHAKMLILDDAVAVYSGNWVYSGMNTNHEAGALADLPDVAAAAATYFDGVWGQSTP